MTPDELKAAFAPAEHGNVTKVEAGNFVVFICQLGKSPTYFSHTDAETLALILRRLEGIDIDLIHSLFQALEGKYLLPQDWQNLVEIVAGFDPGESR